MRQLVFQRPGVLDWEEAPEPRLQTDREAIVRPLAATTCDLDRLIIQGRAPFEGPFPIGHECLAEVVELGDSATGLELGQRVAVTWHISCGECRRCAAGLSAHCEEVSYGAMFGLPVGGDWGGLFSDLVRVPYATGMLKPVDKHLDQGALASAGDNLALALECLARHRDALEGARILILGLGSVGLYAVDLARALGAGEIVYVDADPERLELARGFGADPRPEPPERSQGEFQLAIDAAAEPEWLRAALPLLEPEGALECPSLYFEDLPLPLLQMTIRGVRFHTGRGNAWPYLDELTALVSDEAIHPERLVSEVLDWDELPRALAEPSLKPVFVQ